MPAFHLAAFSADVTPPAGHPLCGGWIEPVRGVDDPLRALGVVLLGGGAPVVLCVVDWCGIRNDSHRAWRRPGRSRPHHAGASRGPERPPAQRPVCGHRGAADHRARSRAPPLMDIRFFDDAVRRSADALRSALTKTTRFTAVGTGKAKVEQVASNRRIVGPTARSGSRSTARPRTRKSGLSRTG